jgi:hypothetical protein
MKPSPGCSPQRPAVHVLADAAAAVTLRGTAAGADEIDAGLRCAGGPVVGRIEDALAVPPPAIDPPSAGA